MNSEFEIIDLKPVQSSFNTDVLEGLKKNKKTLDCKYLYDEKGIKLFDKICELKEYYITRTELKLLKEHAESICEFLPSNCHFIEYGSGSSHKIKTIFDVNQKIRKYTAIDISLEYLQEACKGLAKDYSHLDIVGICADYMHSKLAFSDKDNSYEKVVYFPGSTIGNLGKDNIHTLLENTYQNLNKEGWFFLGVDLLKPKDILLNAYNDSDGITAEFNLNILERINRELGGNFNLGSFQHEAIWNEKIGRIEMHLNCNEDQKVTVCDQLFEFKKGESIFTESSYKYEPEEIVSIFKKNKFNLVKNWTDSNNYFEIFLFKLE